MTRTRAIGIGVAVLCIAASALTWQATKRERQSVEAAGAQTEAATAGNAAAVPPAGVAAPTAAGFAMDSSSLRGTEADGGVSLDASGNVVLDLRLRRLFDYYLSLIGERDRAQIRQLLDAYLLDHSSMTTTRLRETAMLCRPEVRAWLAGQDVQLVTYDDLT